MGDSTERGPEVQVGDTWMKGGVEIHIYAMEFDGVRGRGWKTCKEGDVDPDDGFKHGGEGCCWEYDQSIREHGKLVARGPEAPGRDWSKWLPVGPLPDTGPKELKDGQVWAYSRAKERGVVRVLRMAWVTVLAGDLVGTDTRDNSTGFSSADRARNAVLVADVGCEPTPPHVLYGTDRHGAPQLTESAQADIANVPGPYPAGHCKLCGARLNMLTHVCPPRRGTYASLLAAHEASEGITRPTCRQCRAVVASVNQSGECFGCHATDDADTALRMAEVHEDPKPAEPEAWRPSCDPDFDLPDAQEGWRP